MATGPDLSSSAAAATPAPRKDRHIVSWSAEEDDVLRAQIAQHGTDNWTIIAAQFKDKTARQCRRRWYNYLNSECKKGGWSREEDMLLCEAQKVLGNKWTEIAKVVSGRTDNAVKNRFSTLCKRRVKDEEVFKENGALCSNANAKRIMTQTGCLISGAAGSSPPIKQMRSCKPDFKENVAPKMGLFRQEKSTQQDSRQPLAIISPVNQHHLNIVETQNVCAKTTTGQLFGGEQNCLKTEGNFLKKNDPKFATLVQQADLLCSLATKINTENTSQCMDEAWQKLHHHLVKKDDIDTPESNVSGIASLLEELDDLIVDPYENEDEDEQKSREQNGDIDVDNKEELDDLIVDPYENEDEDKQKPREQNGYIDMDNKQSSGPSQSSTEVTAQMLPDKKFDDSSLCRNELPSTMESCPEILASVNMSEDSKDSRVQCMEYSSPTHTVLQVKANAEIPAYEVEESSLHCMDCTSPDHTILQTKADAQLPASQDFSESAEDTRLECTEFISPIHKTAQAKASAEIPTSENFSEVAEDSKLPCMEFNSPAYTVPTFQSYADDMPTPKITASERNFLLSVLELTSPEPRPDTSQQPSCKRALLNSL